MPGPLTTDTVDTWAGLDARPNTADAQDLIEAGIMETMVPCVGLAPVGHLGMPVDNRDRGPHRH